MSLDERERVATEEQATPGGRAVLAQRMGIARNTLDRAMLGGRVYAGTALLIRRAVGLDPGSPNYRPTTTGSR